MKFKVDENLHDEVAELLAQAGHDAHTVHTENLRGIDDLSLSMRCQQEGRAIITLDLDFADIRSFPPASHLGIVVLRVGDQSRGHILRIIADLLKVFQQQELTGRLWIVSETGVRIRES